MRVRRVLLVVAKVNTTVTDTTVTDVGVQSPRRAEVNVWWGGGGMNVSLPEGEHIDTVVVPFQITVWVANVLFLAPVLNALYIR